MAELASDIGASGRTSHAGPPPAGSPLVEVRGLTVAFRESRSAIRRSEAGAIRAVDGIDLLVRPGETLGLVGESGSGKSTTGRAILQLVRPTSGSVLFDGQDLASIGANDLRRLRRRMQMIFQSPYASLNPRRTIGAMIADSLEIHDVAHGREKDERVSELLRLVGLTRLMAGKYPHEFSGGQRQRVGIARALASNPDFVVADEPVSALDVSVQAQIVNLLVDLQDRLGLSYLFIAHDLAVIRHVSTRVAVMYLGKIVESADRSDLYQRPLHPYTHALLSAVPVPDPAIEAQRSRLILENDIPSPSDPPSGCRFRTRCWLRAKLGNPDACLTEPELIEHDTRHWAACHFVR